MKPASETLSGLVGRLAASGWFASTDNDAALRWKALGLSYVALIVVVCALGALSVVWPTGLPLWTGLQWGHAAHGGSSWIVWLWAVGLISLGFVLVHPLVGLLTYLVMAFSIHGAGNYYWVLHRQGVLHWALVLAFVGCVLWRCRYENKVWLSADLMTRCILVLIIWVFVCHIVALIGGRDEPPRWNRQPVYFIHCLLTFWLASCLLRTRQQLVLLFGVIAGTLLFGYIRDSQRVE